MTVAAVLTQGGTVVSAFDGLIILVAGLTVGVWATRFVLSRVQRLG